MLRAEQVQVSWFHFRHYPVDPDDVAFVLAAINGKATHLVTRDKHLTDVAHFYHEFSTCGAKEFLLKIAQAKTGSTRGEPGDTKYSIVPES